MHVVLHMNMKGNSPTPLNKVGLPQQTHSDGQANADRHGETLLGSNEGGRGVITGGSDFL